MMVLECEWYIVNLISDSTFGVLLQYIYLQLVESWLKGTKYGFESGDYIRNDCFSWSEYLYQMFVWWLIVITSKVTQLAIILLFYQWFKGFGIFLLKQFKGRPRLKLVFVMIIFPLIFNSLQYWITDNFIQKKIKVSSDLKDNNEDGKENKQNDTANGETAGNKATAEKEDVGQGNEKINSDKNGNKETFLNVETNEEKKTLLVNNNEITNENAG